MHKRILLVVLSAILFVIAFPPWNYYVCIFIFFVPYLFAIQDLTLKQRLYLSALMSCVISYLGFYWVMNAIHSYGQLPWLISFLIFQLFAFFNQSQFYFYSSLEYFSKSKNDFSILFLSPLFYTISDLMIPKMFQDSIAYALFSSEFFKQAIDISGISLLIYAIGLINISFFCFLKNKMTKFLLLPICIVVLLFSYGYFRISSIKESLNQQDRKSLKVALIQANIGELIKLASEKGISKATQLVMDAYINLTEKALQENPDTEVVVWPETAFFGVYRDARRKMELNFKFKVLELLSKYSISFFFGGYDTTQDYKKDYNSFYMLSPNQPLEVYHKTLLMAFSEVMPGSNLFPFLKKIFPQVGDFQRGEGPTVYRFKNIQFQPTICYEDLIPWFIRKGYQKGSEVIFNITNDSWFGNNGPYLHLALATFRSIETRQFLIRATNTGVSAIVDLFGNIIKSTPLNVATYLFAEVPIYPKIFTLSQYLGDWFGALCKYVFVGLLVYNFRNCFFMRNRRCSW